MTHPCEYYENHGRDSWALCGNPDTIIDNGKALCAMHSPFVQRERRHEAARHQQGHQDRGNEATTRRDWRLARAAEVMVRAEVKGVSTVSLNREAWKDLLDAMNDYSGEDESMTDLKTERTAVWQMVHVDEAEGRLEQLLAEGWEPFAVMRLTQSSRLVYLKRQATP